MANEPAYSVQMTEKQLQLLQRALHTFTRIELGQFYDIADTVALSPDRPATTAEVQVRDQVIDTLTAAYKQAHPDMCVKSKDAQEALDITMAIRHKLWTDQPEPKPHDTVESRQPLWLSGTKPIRIEKTD